MYIFMQSKRQLNSLASIKIKLFTRNNISHNNISPLIKLHKISNIKTTENYLQIFYKLSVQLLKKKFFIKFSKQLNANITQYISKVLDMPIRVNSINCSSVLANLKILRRYKSLKECSWRRYKILYIIEVFELFLVSFYVKHLRGLIRWIKRYFEGVHFKKHQTYISFIFLMFRRYIIPLARRIRVKGFKFFIKGKIARGGSVKKSKKEFTFKVNSLSKKALKLIYEKSYIRTKSGVLGYGLYLFY